MKMIRIKLSELFGLSGETPPSTKDIAAVTMKVMEKYGFLPQPMIITLEDDVAVVQFPEESEMAQAEAERLAVKGAKRAAQGEHDKAIGIFKKALEHQPSLYSARRDLAMAYSEIGKVDDAIHHLLEVLRIMPDDAWSLVVLANLYIQKKNDTETGRRLLEKAIEVKPNDSWALNSLAAIELKKGNIEQAIELFEQAIKANPENANPYYGKAVAYEMLKKVDVAADSLAQLFSNAKMQDARSKGLFEMARSMYEQFQNDLAKTNESDAFKCIQSYKTKLEQLSGYPIRINEEDFEDKVGARIQMAWKHGRDYHLVSTRRGYSPVLLSHLEAHELTHLKLETEARNVGKNLYFATSGKSREAAIRSIESDVQKLKKKGYSESSLTNVMQTLVNGLSGFLFNCPIDMIIERHLRSEFPILHPAQYLSTKVLATEAWQVNSDPKVIALTPRKIMRATNALNGANAIFLDVLFGGGGNCIFFKLEKDRFVRHVGATLPALESTIS